MVQTLTGALQGIGKQMYPVKNLAYGAVVKIILTYFLVATTFFNVNGAAIGTIGAYIVASFFDVRDLKKQTGIKFDIMLTFVKPFVASAIMGVLALLSYKLFALFAPNIIATFFAVLIGVISYIILVLFLKAITTEEMLNLPKGDKLVAIIDKVQRK